jgi:hypothetical protein
VGGPDLAEQNLIWLGGHGNSGGSMVLIAGNTHIGNCPTHAGWVPRPAIPSSGVHNMPKTLTNREDIRQWAAARAGNPMLMETPDGAGSRTLLQLTFGQYELNTDGNQGPDRIGGFQLVSWDEWFTALDANNLAVRVSDDPSGGNEAEFEFVQKD